MESTAVRILALLGLAAVAASAALLCAGPLIAVFDGLLKKWRRMGFVPRVVAVLMAAVATVKAQKSGKSLGPHPKNHAQKSHFSFHYSMLSQRA
jgi:hypothetical protein